MKFLGDYHTHTVASDGHSTLEQNVAAATKAGLEEIVVSDHGFKSVFANMTSKNFDRQQAFIDAEKSVRVLQGIESNILNPEGDIDTPDEYIRRLDVLTVGFHRYVQPKFMFSKFIFVNGFCSTRAKRALVDANTSAYVNALSRYPIDIVAHLNHKAPVNARPIFDKAKETGAYVELNAKHLDAFLPLVKDAIESGVNFIVSSDAHMAKDIGQFEEIEKFIKENNIPLERVFGIEGNKPTFKDKTNWRGEK
ncbi:MAG: hypothetical protein II867_01370 [Clostridia bacterium]|nr:hypothetical protein [Clostridia bacterium]